MKVLTRCEASVTSGFSGRMIMTHRISLLVLWIGAWGSNGGRVEPDVVCRDGAGYTYNDICCLNCPAGTFVKEACSKAYVKGLCQPCDFDTYTEHDNGLSMCLKCTKCRPDQELVERCTSTRNTHCQCKAGSFCRPDQACEVCKTCRKCKEDEEVVESCTAHSNTVCQKRDSESASMMTAVAVVSGMAFVMIMVTLCCFLSSRTSAGCKQSALRWQRGMWKSCIENGSDLVDVKQNSVNGALEEAAPIHPFFCQTQPVGEDMVEDEEDKGLGPSLPNTTTSSQTSLPVCALISEYRQSHSLPQQLNTLENENLQRLVPLNGDDSLRKSFDLFGEIDVNFHNRFFRALGLNDNAIRNAEVSCSSHEDRVYELLKVWMEKEGMKADFNNLIEALLSLNQRMSAENIVGRAIESGIFRYKED